ncbi:MAG: FAD-binding oxidoreductase [Saprospiraceae bacterium]|nr:FAD-binding oxidoreductase [Saprospiraceae bacterium]
MKGPERRYLRPCFFQHSKPPVIASTDPYDFLIVGGGLFGVYAALYLAGHGCSVALVEMEDELLKKASIVNQARLHSGYHYPRSVATARMSDDHKERFIADHRPFVLFDFEKYYAIDKYGSFTDAGQFERFCDFIGIRREKVEQTHPWFNFERIEALYATTEYTFDPVLIAEHYRQKVEKQTGVRIFKSTMVKEAGASGQMWEVVLEHRHTGQTTPLRAAQVINATYAGSNAVNRSFGVDDISLMHEISEIAFVTSPQIGRIGLTVMDGQFGSIMPYGLSGLLSLSSVAYTHHKVSYDNLPTFHCQSQTPHCRPQQPGNCNFCPAQPPSNAAKMMAQIKHYFRPEVELRYYFSLFTIKSKLKASYIDDGRPTEISCLSENPRYYCIFAGKINSIYEIEKIIVF